MSNTKKIHKQGLVYICNLTKYQSTNINEHIYNYIYKYTHFKKCRPCLFHFLKTFCRKSQLSQTILQIISQINLKNCMARENSQLKGTVYWMNPDWKLIHNSGNWIPDHEGICWNITQGTFCGQKQGCTSFRWGFTALAKTHLKDHLRSRYSFQQ